MFWQSLLSAYGIFIFFIYEKNSNEINYFQVNAQWGKPGCEFGSGHGGQGGHDEHGGHGGHGGRRGFDISTSSTLASSTVASSTAASSTISN